MKARRLTVLVLTACLLPADLVVAAVLLIAQVAAIPLKLIRLKSTGTKPADPASATIQILNWDGRAMLEEFLPGVIQAAGSHPVVVVDNGSTDGSLQLLKTRFPQVRAIPLEKNFGFGEGNNLGSKQVDTDVIVFLNNDMAVDEGFLRPLLCPFSDPSVFAVASRITVPDPAKASQETGNTHARFEHGFFEFRHDPLREADEVQSPGTPVFWAGGGACAVDRRKFEILGGFDSLYHPFYVEDVDLSYQAWKRGWKSMVAPASSVVHKHRGTSAPRFGAAFVENTTRRNHFLFVWKNLTDSALLIQHLVMLPRIHARAIAQHGGRFEFRAYLRACLRLPLAVVRRISNAGAFVLKDRDVFGLTR
jgi:GT2 family glycosyltransferase